MAVDSAVRDSEQLASLLFAVIVVEVVRSFVVIGVVGVIALEMETGMADVGVGHC